MQLMDAIVERRAVREYQDTPVEWTRIKCFINAAILAPSAMNRQPWAFAVLLNPERIEEYASRAKAWLLANSSEDSLPPPMREMLNNPDYSLFHHAPALVLVLAASSDAQASEDCCLAAENFMLAARDDEIGTCWVGLARPWLNLPSTKADLKLPEHYQVVAPIVLGYPKAWPGGHERNPAEIHWLD
jgi:nitroreductase